ncbi:MAG TPA: hypothetical protein VE890_02880 [Thermoguttaceae bacterium]|nr:hypothetical protein [Thermoguttaceae bacterium]
MRLFAENKEAGVQSFLLKLVNNNCSGLEELVEGPRLDGRVNLVIVTLVIPMKKGRPQIKEAFSAVTKEFSTTGVAVVLDGPVGLDDVILGFRWEGEMKFLRGKAKHLNPMGGGFYQLGFQMTETVHVGDFSELRSVIL